MRDYLPGFGQVENGTIEAALVDSVIGAAQLHVVTIEYVLAEDAANVFGGPIGEVFA